MSKTSKLCRICEFIPQISGALTNLNDFTIATWVFINNQANWSRVFDFGYGTSQWLFFTPQTNLGYGKFAIYNGKNEYDIDLPAPLPVGQWVHIAVTNAGGNVTVYVNGQVANNGISLLSPKVLTGNDKLKTRRFYEKPPKFYKWLLLFLKF